MAQEPVLQLKNVTKRYGAKKVVDNLSFDLQRGEIVGLLGPNGAGKTTTMRMIVGLISMTEGDCLINGTSIKSHFVQAVADIGGVIENPEFYPFFTGYENLQHFANMYLDISAEHIDKVVRLIGLEQAINKRVDSYSLGMRQRLGIAQALLHKPSVLILDEPTNGLDPAGIREMRDYFKEIARSEGITILVSSHLLSEIEIMCDRAIIIKNGAFVDSQIINDNAETKTQKLIAFEVDDAIAAQNLLRSAYPDKEIKGENIGSIVTLPLEREQIHDVILQLAAHGVRLYGVREERKKLEEAFLEKVGGNTIV